MDVEAPQEAHPRMRFPESNPQLTTLPPEIRNMIYELLLIRDDPIPICSPRTRKTPYPLPSARPPGSAEITAAPPIPHKIKNFRALTRVNKQLYAEASQIFYSHNIFVLGNGNFGSSISPNMHGLKVFISKVPASNRHAIKKMNLKMHFHPSLWTKEVKDLRGQEKWIPDPNHPYDVAYYGFNQVPDVQAMCKMLVKHFRGLETLRIETGDDTHYSTSNAYNRTGKSENSVGMSKALQMVLKHEKLREILVEASEARSLKVVFEDLLEKRPEAGNVIRLFRCVPARIVLPILGSVRSRQAGAENWVKSLDEVISKHAVVWNSRHSEWNMAA